MVLSDRLSAEITGLMRSPWSCICCALMSTLNLWTLSWRFSIRNSATRHSMALSRLSLRRNFSAFYSFVSLRSSFRRKCSCRRSSIPCLTRASILDGSATASLPRTLIIFFSLTFGGGGGRSPSLTLSCRSLSFSRRWRRLSFCLSYWVM